MNTKTVKAYGTEAKDKDLQEMTILRREVQPNDIEIDILYCGVCHSDLHTARNDWGGTVYPAVPGHEIVGKVTQIGSEVKKYKVGDTVAVGCMVDSCRTCPSCQKGMEQYCDNGMTGTYNSKDKYIETQRTYGGYSQTVVVDENYVLKVPGNLDLAAVAPLLCAGITTYSPLRHWNVNENSKVAVVGLGGLGHMALKLAKGMGAHVSLFSRTPSKEQDAKVLGADEVIISTDDAHMKSVAGKFDLIIDTVPYDHDVQPYMQTLKVGGTHVLVGFIGSFEEPVSTKPMIYKRRSLAGSLIGGIAETQEMLDFCGEKNIVSDIELIKIQDINEAYERMLKSDVKYRFVIDMKSLE